MPRHGSPPSLYHALLLLLVVIPSLATAAQQQQPLRNANAPLRRSPPELALLDPSNRQRRSSVASLARPGKDTAIVPTRERALATVVAPADVSQPAVRAHPARPSADGLSSRLPARSLQDWKVEDIILLATVDGKIHARDRNSGKPKWELETDRPMVETTYHRNNKSTQDAPGENDFLWIVEPSQDGALYVYAPGPRLGMQKLGLTVKQLVEELSPYAGEDPPVVYTAEKKNTLYTVDAGDGNILKFFSPAGSISNNDRSCRKVNALETLDETECDPVGTLTLGRTEYIVGIQDKSTGDPICTIRYFEWSPNNRDKDLHEQYANTLDDRYVYSKHDGSIMALDHITKDNQLGSARPPRYIHRLSSPVARVYDVVRPEDDSEDPSLVILPQPIGPIGSDVDSLDNIFVNCTEEGSWYALSEQSYPLVTDGAAQATVYDDDNSVLYSSLLQRQTSAKHRANLVGIHPLSLVPPDRQSIPTISAPEQYKPIGSPAEVYVVGSEDLMTGQPSKPWTATLPSPWTMLFMVLCALVVLSPAQKQWPKLFKAWRKAQPVLESPLAPNEVPANVAVPAPDMQTEEAQPPAGEDLKVRVPEPAEETIFPQDVDSEQETKAELSLQVSTEETPRKSEDAQSEHPVQEDGTPNKPEKKARRGVRGGRQAKQKRLEQEQAQQRRRSNSNSKGKTNGLEVTKIVDEAGLAPSVIEPVHATQIISVEASESPIVSGKIQINSLMIDTDRIIGHGSAGTCVFEGNFEGRDVAVKRMLSQYYELASQEVSFLQQSDDHENVIRYFCQQKDQHFLYIAVELCQASLWDLYYSDTREEGHRQQLTGLLSAILQDVPRALYQLAAGLRHLHNRRIIHRDIKPQNILIAFPKRFETNKGPRLVISDFGLCKTLPENVSTLVDPTGNAGTCGWKAPELISQPKDTLSVNGHSNMSQPTTSESTSGAIGGVKRAADIFSLGCLFFWVLTGGSHPFDDKEGWMQMRELNIKKNNLQNMHKLDLGSDTEEPLQLITAMLAHRPEDRPTALDVLSHPFFWKPDTRLAFLCDVSDHFEREPRDPPSAQLELLEACSAAVIGSGNGNCNGAGGDFLRKLDKGFVDTLGKQRKYTGSRMLDLLRALRNKKNHYEDMPEDVKRRVGALPAGYLMYWTTRFPKLLMACYCCVRECGVERGDRFRAYFDVEE